MLPPSSLHDDANPTGDRRGADGAPPYGRRQDDEHALAVLSEMRALHADVMRVAAAQQPWTWQRITAVVGGASIIFGAISAALIWLGGGIIGPGARFDEFRAAQMRADTVAAREREFVLDAVESMNATVARFGYDMCTGVHKKPERECFDNYIAQATRRLLPRPRATTAP